MLAIQCELIVMNEFMAHVLELPLFRSERFENQSMCKRQPAMESNPIQYLLNDD